MNIPSSDQIQLFKSTPGAISVCEMLAIANLASEATPFGARIDLGSNAGKAAISAAIGLSWASELGKVLHCVDPVFDLTNREAWANSIQGKPENCPWGWVSDPKFNQKFSERISTATGGIVNAELHGDYSTHALPKFPLISWCFIDSDDHAEDLIRSELAILKDRMVVGGIIAFHDFGNYPAVERVMREFLSGSNYEECSIDWDSIKSYVASNNLEEGNDSWHCREERLPCHVAAIKRIK